ncbi:hypothetical protein NQ314_020451 [Rhamnusium bicolor]|uniref:Uncharacterized protein n=1 Tax=Rhamnusium bicolor TaxID=1586634 RepID=A0AAV8WK87_9CUCU|nr:hypothetical protein NQ314_020451 [Rhamnusium bicolor]
MSCSAVKKKGRKKKVKDSPPKSSSSTSTSTTASTKLPKADELDIEEFANQIVEKETIKSEVSDEQGPEAGQEPAGPDQSLPVSSDVVNPPPERKVTSYVNVS